jgi:hypothetical protein
VLGYVTEKKIRKSKAVKSTSGYGGITVNSLKVLSFLFFSNCKSSPDCT